jgi:hypothetical protein
MKKGIEWLATMPYRYQVLFLKRLSETVAADSTIRADFKDNPTGIWEIAKFLNKEFPNFLIFLVASFLWEDTPEGHDYWWQMSEGNFK